MALLPPLVAQGGGGGAPLAGEHTCTYTVGDTSAILQVFELQGQHKMWYAGSSVSFESVRAVMEYNNLLLKQMFQPASRVL